MDTMINSKLDVYTLKWLARQQRKEYKKLALDCVANVFGGAYVRRSMSERRLVQRELYELADLVQKEQDVIKANKSSKQALRVAKE